MSQEQLPNFSSITDLGEYLQAISEVSKDLLVVMAVKDTPGHHFPSAAAESMRQLGLNVNLEGKHGHSYGCVICQGTVLFEQLSATTNQDVHFAKIIGPYRINLFSSPFECSNTARIIVDDFDYAINLRGLNIVVFNLRNRRLADSVCFDTHARVAPRYDEKVKHNTQLAALSKKLEQIEQSLKTAEEIRRVDSARTQLMLWHAMSDRQPPEESVKYEFFRSLPPARGTLRKLQLAQFILLTELDRVCKERDALYWLSYGGLLGAVRSGRLIPWDDDLDVCMMREDLELIADAFDKNPDFYFYTFCNLHDGGLDKGYKIGFRQSGTPYSLDIFVMDFASRPAQEIADAFVAQKIKIRAEARRIADSQYGSYLNAPRFLDNPKYLNLLSRHIEAFKHEQLGGGGSHAQQSTVTWGLENVLANAGKQSMFDYSTVFPLSTIELEGRRFPCPAQPVDFVAQIYGDFLSVPDDMFSRQHFHLSTEDICVLDSIIEKHRNRLVGITGSDGRVIEA